MNARPRRLDPAALRPQPTRQGADSWPTPACLAGALVRHVLPTLPAGRIWEPACGAGNLAVAMRQAGRDVVASDLPAIDFLSGRRPRGTFAAIVTNPPFNRLDSFLAYGLAHVDAGLPALVLLLRWDHLTAAGRVPLVNRASAIHLCAWRPRWIADSTTGPRWSFAWCTWCADRAGPPILAAWNRGATP